MARPQTVSDEQILAAMRASVLAHGPSVSLEVVAETLQVSTPAILKRFGTRKALMLSALRPPMIPPWLALLDQRLETKTLKKQLLSVFQSVQSFMAEVMPCMVALTESGIGLQEVFEDQKPLPLLSIEALSKWLDDGKRRGVVQFAHSQVLATAVLGAFQMRLFSLRLLNLPYRPEEHREFVEQLAAMVEQVCTKRRSAVAKLSKKGNQRK